MKAVCGYCETKLELEYYIKTKLRVLQVVFSVKCQKCGNIVPMMSTISPEKDMSKKEKIQEIKDRRNYIG